MNTGPLRRLLGLARRAADPTDDAGLLARFAAGGDADAFELLVWRHGGMVLGVARRVLGDIHAAEDVFQATFLALARQAKSVRRDGCVAGWLHRVARRAAVRARRRDQSGLRFARNVNTESPDACTVASRRELSQILDDEIDRLPERFRRAVVLCYLEGRSTAEAAEKLGCPRGTVLSRLATAREKLRVRLLRRGVAPAILPPILDMPHVIERALIESTVRTAAGGTASPPVIELCDGVLRAMILSKIQMTAVVVMTVGLIGGGAGWVAWTPGGPAVALADGPPAKPEPPKADAAQEQRRRVAEQTDRLRMELAVAEDQLASQEESWSRDRAEARLRLAEAEEKYKQLERNAPSDPSLTGSLRAMMADNQSQIEAVLKTNVETNPQVQKLRKQLTLIEEELKTAKAKYDKRQGEVLDARREMVLAEERLSLFDRLTALKRRAAQAKVEDLQDRIFQLQGGTVRSDSSERKVQTLERKLDDLLRDTTEMRRDQAAAAEKTAKDLNRKLDDLQRKLDQVLQQIRRSGRQ